MDKLFRLVPVLAPLSCVLALTFPAMALGVRYNLWGFHSVLPLLAGAALTAAIILALAGFGLLAALRRKHKAVVRRALITILVLAVPVVTLFHFGLKASQVPELYDVSTSWTNPPAIAQLSGVRPEQANPLQTAADNLADQQRFYPTVTTLTTHDALKDVMKKVNTTALSLGWSVVAYAPDRGILEATDQSFWFGFVDDITVRVSVDNEGATQVDVRSVSRIGRSDLGKNAERIQQFLERLQ